MSDGVVIKRLQKNGVGEYIKQARCHFLHRACLCDSINLLQISHQNIFIIFRKLCLIRKFLEMCKRFLYSAYHNPALYRCDIHCRGAFQQLCSFDVGSFSVHAHLMCSQPDIIRIIGKGQIQYHSLVKKDNLELHRNLFHVLLHSSLLQT